MTSSRLVRGALKLGLVVGGLTAGALIWGAAPAFADGGATATPVPAVTVSTDLGPLTPAPVTVAVQPSGTTEVSVPPLTVPPVAVPAIATPPLSLPGGGTTVPTMPTLPVAGTPSPITLPFVPIPAPTGPISAPSAPGASGAPPVATPPDPTAAECASALAAGHRSGPEATAGFGIPALIAPIDAASPAGSDRAAPAPGGDGTSSSGPAAGTDHHDQPTAVLADPIGSQRGAGRLGDPSPDPLHTATPECADPRPG